MVQSNMGDGARSHTHYQEFPTFSFKDVSSGSLMEFRGPHIAIGNITSRKSVIVFAPTVSCRKQEGVNVGRLDVETVFLLCHEEAICLFAQMPPACSLLKSFAGPPWVTSLVY